MAGERFVLLSELNNMQFVEWKSVLLNRTRELRQMREKLLSLLSTNTQTTFCTYLPEVPRGY